jgi:hypothetical protein
MKTTLFFIGFVTIVLCPLSLSAQVKPENEKMKSEHVTFNVSTYNNETTVFKNEKHKYTGKKPNYKIDELSLNGLDLQGVQADIAVNVKKYLQTQKRTSLNFNLPLSLIVLNTGEIAEVTFFVPKEANLSPQDIENIEVIIKKVKVKVKKPELYKNIDFMPIVMVIKK